jgi:hypothetical protein
MLMLVAFPVTAVLVAVYAWMEYPPDTYTDLAYPMFKPRPKPATLMIEDKRGIPLKVIADDKPEKIRELHRRAQKRLSALGFGD